MREKLEALLRKGRKSFENYLIILIFFGRAIGLGKRTAGYLKELGLLGGLAA